MARTQPRTSTRALARYRDSLVLQLLRSRFHADERAPLHARLRSLPPRQLLAVLDRARRLEVAPLVARTLLAVDGIPGSVAEQAGNAYEQNLARNLFLEAEASAWENLFAAAGIPSRPLKGVRLSRLLYADLGAKTCADIDVLVREEDLDRALVVARGRGFCPLQDPLRASDDPDEKAYTLRSSGGGHPYSLDLHWRLEAPIRANLDVSDLWREPGPLATLDAVGATLGYPRDWLGVLLCLHLWRHDMSLKTLMDFAAYVVRFDDAIPPVRARLREARAEAGLDLALGLISRLLGVGSLHHREARVRQIFLPWLASCVRRAAPERGRYLHLLVSPLRFDGTWRPFAWIARYLWRADYRDRVPGLRSRARRMWGAAGRAVAGGPWFSARGSGP